MADATHIIPSEELDFFNTLAFFSVAFIGLFLMLHGAQTSSLNNFALGALGISYVVVILVSGAVIQRLMTSPATPFQAATGYVAPVLLAEIIGGLGNLRLSTYSPSSKGYLSSIVQAAPDHVRALLDVGLVPLAENGAIISFAVIIYVLSGRFTENKPIRILAAAIPMGLMFGQMHAAGSIVFMLSAFSVMAGLIVVLLMEDAGVQDFGVIPVTFALTVGVHKAINIQSWGGLFNHYSLVLENSGTALLGAQIYLAFDLVMFAIFFYGIGVRMWNGKLLSGLQNVVGELG